MKKVLFKLVLVLLVIILILELKILNNQHKDIGLHKPSECLEINEDIFCKISRVIDE